MAANSRKTISVRLNGDVKEGWGINLDINVNLNKVTLTEEGYAIMEASVRRIASQGLDTLENLQDELVETGEAE